MRGKVMSTFKNGGSRNRRLLLTSMAAIGLLLGGVGIASAATSPTPTPAPAATASVPAPAATEASESIGDHCWNDKADANEANDKADANEAPDANEANDKADANEGNCDAVASSTSTGSGK